jgi:hypothetical protein
MGRRLLILFTLVRSVAGVAVSVAQGHDRAPLRVSGLSGLLGHRGHIRGA